MTRIAIDPVTRIEGHLRIEAEVDGGQVADAWSSGTMFRGIELILRHRDPREAWIWAQRICGVCTTVHAIASVRAVEDALGIEVPDNARLIRNLIAGIQMVQDHVVHFYHLHALDWVDVTGALKADTAKTASLAQSISDWPNASPGYFKSIQQRVQTLVDSGQLSLFTSGYWGHPAYKLPPEADLMAVAHYIEALDWQRDVIRVHSVLGGKNPHPQTYLVGGMAVSMDANEPDATINMERLSFIAERFKTAKAFVDQVYVPDVLAVASFYPEWFGYGEGLGNFMVYGDAPGGSLKNPSTFFQPRGIILGRDLTKVNAFDQQKVGEFVTHSWYDYAGGDATAKHPWQGETSPHYAGPTPPFDLLNTDQKYSWLKAPRYDGQPMEVGPLARMLVAYASGNADVKAAVDGVLGKLKAPATALFSTLGRVAARAIETQLMVNQLDVWLQQLTDNLGHGDLQTHDGRLWDPSSWPKQSEGFGWHEAPRGSLGHWVQIEDQKIANYQAVVPSTWNAGPRDGNGQRGAYEAALLKTPVADAERPLEILRTVHSFDPCLACAVHVVDPRKRKLATVQVL
ncbi:MAG: nickel-dependent hydrogenase large subunit [Chloroflexi bacterium]|nr:nickel-dependent hydrogenase large subunit [Chloroflexota bacterium]